MEGNWSQVLFLQLKPDTSALTVSISSLKFNVEEPTEGPFKIRPFKILRGHKASVQSVAKQTSGDMVNSIL